MNMNNDLNLRLNLFATNKTQSAIADVQKEIANLTKLIEQFNATTIKSFNNTTSESKGVGEVLTTLGVLSKLGDKDKKDNKERLQPLVPLMQVLGTRTDKAKQSISQLNQSIVSTASSVIGLSNPINSLDRILSGKGGSLLSSTSETFFDILQKEVQASVEEVGGLENVFKGFGRTFTSFMAGDNTKNRLLTKTLGGLQGATFLFQAATGIDPLISLSTVLGSTNGFLDEFNISINEAGKNLAEYATKAMPKLLDIERQLEVMPDPIGRMNEKRTQRRLGFSGNLKANTQKSLLSGISLLGETPDERETVFSTFANEAFTQTITPALKSFLPSAVSKLLEFRLSNVSNMVSSIMTAKMGDGKTYEYINKISKNRIGDSIGKVAPFVSKKLGNVIYSSVAEGLDPLFYELSNFIPSALSFQGLAELSGTISPLIGNSLKALAAGGPLDDLVYQGFKRIPFIGNLGGETVKKLTVSKKVGGFLQWVGSGEGKNLKQAFNPGTTEEAAPLPIFKGQQGALGAGISTALKELVGTSAEAVGGLVGSAIPKPLKNIYAATRDRLPTEIEAIESRLFDIAYNRLSKFFDRRSWLNLAENLQKISFKPIRNLREKFSRLITVTQESFFGNLPETIFKTTTKLIPSQIQLAWGWIKGIFPQASQIQEVVKNYTKKATNTIASLAGVTADKTKKYAAKSLALDVVIGIFEDPLSFLGIQLENITNFIPDAIKNLFTQFRRVFPNLSKNLEESLVRFVQQKLQIVKILKDFFQERSGFIGKLITNSKVGTGKLIEGVLKSQYERDLGQLKNTLNDKPSKELVSQSIDAKQEAIRFDKLARAERINALRLQKKSIEQLTTDLFKGTGLANALPNIAMGQIPNLNQAMGSLTPSGAKAVENILQELPVLMKNGMEKVPGLWSLIPAAIKDSILDSMPDVAGKQMMQGIFDESFGIFDEMAAQAGGTNKQDQDIIKTMVLPQIQGFLGEALASTFGFDKIENGFQKAADYEQKAANMREKAFQMEQEASKIAATPDQKQAAKDELRQLKEQRKLDKERVNLLEKEKQRLKSLPAFSDEEARAEESRLQQLNGSTTPILSTPERAAQITSINEQILQITAKYQNAFEQIQAKAKLLLEGEGISTDESGSKLYKEIDKIFGGGLTSLLNELGKNAGVGFLRGLIVGTIDNISNSVGKIDRFVSRVSDSLKALPDRFLQPLVAGKKMFAGLAAETTGIKMIQVLRDSFEQFSGNLFMATQQFAIFQSTIQGVTTLAQNNPIATMIRQADEFKQQLITLQSSIASTNQIKLGGEVISNPAEAIKSLEGPIQGAVERLRQGSLELSGITSKQLIDPFIVLSGQMGQLGLNLGQTTNLTLSFASAITSLKLPADQFGQEMRSIVTAQITSDSMVAKTLGITNQMVGRWRSQGKIFDELTKRLEVFRAGQSLTARTLQGLQSNILEVFEESSRIAGAKLLEPLTDNLQKVYDFIFGNKDAITEYISSLVDIALEIGSSFKEVGANVFSSFVDIGSQLPVVVLRTAADAAKMFANAVTSAIETLSPFISLLAIAAQGAVSLSSPFLNLAIQFKVFETAVRGLFLAFGGIMQAMPVVGGLMTAISVRGLPMINVFASLYDKVGLGAAGFLVLGKNMKAIPGLANAITTGLGAKFGPFAAILTGMIPLMSTIGIQAAGLAKVLPFMSAGLTGILKLAPSAIVGVGAQLAALPIFAGNNKVVTTFFDDFAKSINNFTGAGNMSIEVSKLFQKTVGDIGSQFKIFILQTAALGAGLLLLGTAIDQLILKNKAALDVLKITLGVLIDIPRILVQETIPAIAQLPHIFTITAVTIGGVVTALLGVKTVLISVGAAATLATTGGVGFLIGRMILLQNAINDFVLAIQSLIVAGLTPMASQIGMAGDALTTMAARATAAAAAQNALTASTNGTTIATQAAMASNFKLSGTFLMTTKQAAALGPALTTLSVALAAVASGTGTTTAAWQALMGTMKMAAIPLLSIVALVGVALVAALLAASARFSYLQKEMADWNKQTNTMLDTSAKIERVMIRNAKAQEQRTKYGIALTQEEYTKNKRIRELAIKDIEALNQQITDVKASSSSFLNKAEIENQVQILEDQIKRIQSRTENIQISSRPLQELGGTIEQLGEKSTLALQGITNASGDPEAFKQAAETLTKITQQEYELGAVSEQVAAERLESLINNTKLDVDLRVSAEQALQKIRETSTQKRIEEEKKAQQKIQSLADEGKLSEAKASQETLNLRLKEIEIQLSAEKKAHEERMRMRKAELAYEWEKVNSEIEAKERTLKYDSAKDSTEAKTDLTKQQQKLADIKAQLDAGSKKIEEFQAKGGAATAEEKNQLQLLKSEQKNLETQQSSYVELIKYLESTIAKLDLKEQAPEQLEKIAQSLQGVDAEIKDAEAKLQGLTGKGQKAEKADVQIKLDEMKARQKGLLDEQFKYNSSTQEMNDEAKQKLNEQLKGLKADQENIEKSGNSVLEEEQRKHNNKLAELEAEKAKIDKEKRDKAKQERLKDFDEQLKISEAARINGLKDEQQAAIDAQKINEGKVREEMKQLAERKAKLTEEAKKQGKTLQEYDKEAAEEIRTQEAEHQQKLTEIRKQAFQRRMSDLKEDLSEQMAVIEAAQETGKIDNQQAADQGLDATKKNAKRQLELIKQQLSQLKSTDIEGREELLKQRAELEKQVAQAEKKALKDKIADDEQDTEEKLSGIELAEKKGADKQINIQQSLTEKTKGINKQLELIQQAKKTARGEYLEELIAQERKLQGKLIDVEREAMEQRLNDLKEDADEEQAIIDAKESAGGDKTKSARDSLKSREDSIKKQLAILNQAMLKASGEALEKLKAQEAKLIKELNDARRAALDKELADIKEDSEERIAGIERQEAEGADKQATIGATRAEKEKEINARIKAIQKALLTATGENYEKLKAEENKAIKELHDMRRQMLEQQLADLREDSDERMAEIEAAESGGLDKQIAARQAYAEKEKSINQQLALIRKAMLTATGENLERLKAQEAKLIKEMNDARKQLLEQQLNDLKEDADERVAILEKQESDGANKQEIIAKTQAIREADISARIALIRKAMLTASGENLEALKAQEARLGKELNDMRRQMMEQSLSDLKEDLDERLTAIDTLESRGVDKQKLIGQRLEEQEKELNARLAIIRRAMLSATGENLERLKAQENKANKELIDLRRQAFEQKLNDLKEDSDEQSTILESRFIDDKITENQYYQQRLQTTLSFLDKQLQLIKAAQANLSQDQIEEQERLASQEAQILKARESAISEFQEQQLQLLDREQKKASQIIEIAEIERSKQLQQAFNDGLIQQTDVDIAKLESTRQRINAELNLEIQKLNFLKAQPPFNDPRKEEERQSKIRESQKRTAQLQFQLLEQQRQEQELLFKKITEGIDRQVAKIQNSATAVQQKLEIELKQQDYLTKALDNQNRILQARQGLQSALGQFIENEFKIMEATAKTEKERERVGRLQSDYKLQALYTEQETQRRMLEIDIKRNEIAQKRAEMENKIAQIKAGADVAKAQADLAKIQADPNAKPEQIEAARLAVDASLATLAGAIAESQSLAQQRGIMDEENAMKRQTQAVQQQTQLRGAELERIQAIKNPRRQQLELKALSGQITPFEMDRLARMKETEQYRKELEKLTQRPLINQSLTSEGVIKIARQQQTELSEKDLLKQEISPVDFEGIVGSLSANLSSNVIGAIGEGNGILSSIAGQLGNILGVIKNPSTKPQSGNVTVNNISGGPTSGQVRDIANQESLKTFRGVLRSAL